MSESTEKKSLRNSIGSVLQNNKLALGGSLIIIASISGLNLIPGPWSTLVSLLLIWLVSWLMRGTWSDLGMSRPRNIGKTIAIGVGVAIISELFVILVLLPLGQKAGIKPVDYSGLFPLKGNVGLFLMYLLASWTTAGFGEEVLHRGFLMGYLARLFGGKKIGWWVSLLVVSILFGLGHAYQGPMGMLLVTYSGLVFGTLYIVSGRNLWFTIIAHGTADTIVFLLLFTGLAERFL